MAHKMQLSTLHKNTVLNSTSKKQEPLLINAVNRVKETLSVEFRGVRFVHVKQVHLNDVINNLKNLFPDVKFCDVFDDSSMRPDGGVLSILDSNNAPYPILISEKKNQGTNDLRKLQGKKDQAKGNAIERLGKNVIGFRASLLNESIFPFVCFGDGCDFASDSSILDRVKTIAMFGALNEIHLHNEGAFNRGTYYFQVPQWTEEEMYNHSIEIARRSILYYFSKYGKNRFCKR